MVMELKIIKEIESILEQHKIQLSELESMNPEHFGLVDYSGRYISPDGDRCYLKFIKIIPKDYSNLDGILSNPKLGRVKCQYRFFKFGQKDSSSQRYNCWINNENMLKNVLGHDYKKL